VPGQLVHPAPAVRRTAPVPDAAAEHDSTGRDRSPTRWARPEVLGLAAILLVVGLAHGANMLDFPYYESDEGTYMSQAWSVATQGRLAPYVYTYDHAPLGWLQLAAWTSLSGGFAAFGSAVGSGRVFMLVLQIASAYLVYRVTRSVASSALAAGVATLAFGLSAYGIYYHRRVLLDNVSTFWMLLSIALLVEPRISRRRIALSALAMGVSILSKEVTLAAAPAMAYLVYVRQAGRQRWVGVFGWTGLVGIVCATYPLMALLRGELWPAGTAPDGTPLVSLVTALEWQASRGRDGGLLDPSSRFWSTAVSWARSEPFLVLAGGLASVLAVLGVRSRPAVGALGLASLSFWLFFARGGEIFAFYLVPALTAAGARGLPGPDGAWLLEPGSGFSEQPAHTLAEQPGLSTAGSIGVG
jgi:hypothetical protein